MADTRHTTPARKTALAPDVRRLDDRAARAWTERMAVRPLADGRYAVDSQSGATYVVDLDDGSCTCPDNELRGAVCKHVRRVAIEVSTQRVPPPGKRFGTCRSCGVETTVPRDADPPALCDACDLDPGDVVRDREADRREASERASGDAASRETGDRLVVRAVTDRRAGEVAVEDASDGEADGENTVVTVADYETNEGYPDDDIVVETTYLADYGRDDPRRYSFPRSRLERVDDAAILD